MTLLLTHDEVRAAVTMDDAILAMEGAFREEGEGRTLLPQRINIKAGNGGWLRVGPVVLEGSGWMGFKAMNLTPGKGVRYQVHLYDIESGALRCIMDAQHLTTLRTGATSAVATRRLARPGKAVTALLGSGPEARAQLDAMVAAGFVAEARIFSPTQANRERLAEEFRARNVDARAVGSAEEACSDASLILAAVKSSEPVLMGKWLRPGTHVNSVGTARKDQRELDLDVFKRAERIVVDTRKGVFGEAGDAVAAADLVREDDVHELSALVGGKLAGRQSDDQITLFKSVGTGIQDIAVAATIYAKAQALGLGSDLGEFPYLKSNKA
jgi:ornithine cyclodeaminase/alanine dehydrogenase-like protein (mu-crystallin family)